MVDVDFDTGERERLGEGGRGEFLGTIGQRAIRREEKPTT